MTLPDNSLTKYKNTVITSGQPANNYNRPNLDYKNGGRLESTNYNSIQKATPKVYWDSFRSTDPILKFNSTSSSVKNSDIIDTVSTISAITACVGGVATTVSAVANAFKSAKATNSKGDSSQPADKNLSSLTQTANNYDKNSDANAMMNTSQNLGKAIKTSKEKLNNAKRTSETAQNTITNLESEKADWEGKRSDFQTEKDSLETSIESNKRSLDELKAIPEDKRTPEQNTKISELEKSISESEKKLKEDYSDSKLETIDNQIARIDEDIEKWTNTKMEADIEAQQLPDEIKSAEKAKDSLDKKIMSQAS